MKNKSYRRETTGATCKLCAMLAGDYLISDNNSYPKTGNYSVFYRHKNCDCKITPMILTQKEFEQAQKDFIVKNEFMNNFDGKYKYYHSEMIEDSEYNMKKSIGISNVFYDGIKTNVANEINNTTIDFLNQYPEAIASVGIIGTFEGIKTKFNDMYVNTLSDYLAEVAISRELSKNILSEEQEKAYLEKIKEDYLSYARNIFNSVFLEENDTLAFFYNAKYLLGEELKFIDKYNIIAYNENNTSQDNIKKTVLHEMTHVLDSALGYKLSARANYFMENLLNEIGIEDGKEYYTGMNAYYFTNDKEFLAGIFEEKLSGNENETIKIIFEELNRYYRSIKK